LKEENVSERNFLELLEARWAEGKFVCVGLDSELGKIPEAAQTSDSENQENLLGLDPLGTLFCFNRAIVDTTHDLVCAYKPNTAFYEEHGPLGWQALKGTIEYIHEVAPGVLVILDAKRGDIGNTNLGYVRMAFDHLQADAITVHPYLGGEALQPFLDRADKGIFVLCRTSNSGAGEFQDCRVSVSLEEVRALAAVGASPWTADFRGHYLTTMSNHVAYQVSNHWNANRNCALVVGATYPFELESVRRIVGDMPILIPGIGAQGGDVEATVKAGKDSRGWRMIINSSRGIIFASSGPDFADAARRETLELREQINRYR
jgi:orotidine-5'-phosphate decarboxylase